MATKEHIYVTPLGQFLLNLELVTDAALQPMVQACVENEILTV